MRIRIRHRLQEQEKGQEGQSSGATGSPSSQPAQDQGSPQDKKTPETSGPKSDAEAIDKALGETASDEVAQAALDGRAAPEKKDEKAADKGGKGADDEASRIADEDKKAAAGDKDAIAAKKVRDDAAKAETDKKAADAEKQRIAEEDRKAAAGDPEAIAAKKKRDDAAKAQDDEGADDPDPYAPPTSLKERSAKRWDNLAKLAREGQAGKKIADEYNRIFQSTGASADEIGGALRVLRQIKSGRADDLREALKTLDRNRAEIAKQLGQEVPGVDLLDDFPDLKERVDKMSLSREDALQLANSRRSTARNEEATRRQEAARTNKANVEKRVKDAQDALSAVGAELEGKDLDYGAKVDLLKENGIFDWICKSFQPEQWGEAFRTQYNLLGKVTPRPKTGAGAGGGAGGGNGGGHEPLRPTGGAGGGKGSPKSDLEAVEAALGM